MSWTLKRRLVVSLVAVGVVLVSVVTVAAILLVQLRDEQSRLANDYFRANNQANDSFNALLDAETAVRGYALTGRPDVLEPLRLAFGEAQEDRRRSLRAFVADEPELAGTLDRFDSHGEQFLNGYSRALVDQVTTGGIASVRVEQITQGKTLFDQLRGDFQAFREQLLQRRADLRDVVNRETAALFGVVALAAMLALIGSLALYVALRLWVTTPLDQLRDNVRRVRDGDLEHEVVPTGPPELAAVAGDVDDMRRALLARLEEVAAAGDQIEAARERLEEQAKELARSNRDLEQFAYVASHDLQEPLRKVASFCQLLERRYAGQLDERADQYIAFAVDGAKRMQQLINDLLAFSRVGRAGPAQFRVVPLQAAYDRAVLNLAAALDESGAQVSTDPLPEVRGEAGLLAQLMQNLIGNGLKFRGEPAPVIRISVARHDDVWELAVVDNGIGVEPQYAERVFVIFQRLHPKSAYEGTGIGLAMCKRIVEHHGGRIWLEPGPSGGTAVRFTLPVADSPEPDEDAGAEPELPLQEEPA